MKKSLLLLSTLLLVSGKIQAKDFTLVEAKYEKTKSTEPKMIEVKIDSGDNNWVQLQANDKAVILKSKVGSRNIYWRDPSNPNTRYQTKKDYKYPEAITIKDGGKKYDMVSGASGISGLDREKNQTPNTFTDKGESPADKKRKADEIKEYEETKRKIAQLEEDARKKELATQTQRAQDEAKKDAAIKQKALDLKKSLELKKSQEEADKKLAAQKKQEEQNKSADEKKKQEQAKSTEKPARPGEKPAQKKDDLKAPDIKEFEKSQKEKEATKKAQDLTKKTTQPTASPAQQQADYARAQVYKRRINMIPALESISNLTDSELAKLDQNTLDDIIEKIEGTDDQDDLDFIEKKTKELVTKQSSGQISGSNLLTMMSEQIENRKKEALAKKAAKAKNK